MMELMKLKVADIVALLAPPFCGGISAAPSSFLSWKIRQQCKEKWQRNNKTLTLLFKSQRVTSHLQQYLLGHLEHLQVPGVFPLVSSPHISSVWLRPRTKNEKRKSVNITQRSTWAVRTASAAPPGWCDGNQRGSSQTRTWTQSSLHPIISTPDHITPALIQIPSEKWVALWHLVPGYGHMLWEKNWNLRIYQRIILPGCLKNGTSTERIKE